MSEWREDYLETIKTGSHIKRHAEAFFYEAMIKGYVTNDSILEGQYSGSRKIDIEKGSWRLVDEYIVTKAGPGSGGTTIIWYGHIPVWMMQYLGWYKENAIPCLKAAIASNYQKLKFEGGRGPQFFVHHGVHYVNHLVQNDFFDHAYGREDVYIPNGEHLGFHRYHSQWLAEGLW